ncbi:unnamed protein product [Somion occarium]|uniref:Uncharacterized protein n=1 Tax=Somion occarium TaxID=3059160 RepID=A0ABP1CSQ4_9APHY
MMELLEDAEEHSNSLRKESDHSIESPISRGPNAVDDSELHYDDEPAFKQLDGASVQDRRNVEHREDVDDNPQAFVSLKRKVKDEDISLSTPSFLEFRRPPECFVMRKDACDRCVKGFKTAQYLCWSGPISNPRCYKSRRDAKTCVFSGAKQDPKDTKLKLSLTRPKAGTEKMSKGATRDDPPDSVRALPHRAEENLKRSPGQGRVNVATAGASGKVSKMSVSVVIDSRKKAKFVAMAKDENRKPPLLQQTPTQNMNIDTVNTKGSFVSLENIEKMIQREEEQRIVSEGRIALLRELKDGLPSGQAKARQERGSDDVIDLTIDDDLDMHDDH